jgi:hypothetical protein
MPLSLVLQLVSEPKAIRGSVCMLYFDDLTFFLYYSVLVNLFESKMLFY